MSLFVCARCGSIDNSATSPYWMTKDAPSGPLCSACGWGLWHNKFKRQKYNWLFWRYYSDRYVEERWFTLCVLRFKLTKYINLIKRLFEDICKKF